MVFLSFHSVNNELQLFDPGYELQEKLVFTLATGGCHHREWRIELEIIYAPCVVPV